MQESKCFLGKRFVANVTNYVDHVKIATSDKERNIT